MREIESRNFALIFHRNFYPPVEAMLVRRPDASGVVLRVIKGEAAKEYGPGDVLPTGVKASNLIKAWMLPDERVRLASYGFSVTNFTDPCPTDTALAEEFFLSA